MPERAAAEIQPVPGRARISEVMLAWFSWYTRRYLRKHFHRIRISRAGLPPDCEGVPLVVYLNHGSWWDPLAGLFLKNEYFPARKGFAPIDAAMLQRYRFFKRLGFFGVEQGTRRGAVNFLREASSVLKSSDTVIFITPQSRFADVRERPVEFSHGIGHLAARLEHAVFLPLALEYVFWQERAPEILVRFGEAVEVRSELREVFDWRYWVKLLELRLEETQDALADEAQQRRSGDFEVLLRGASGVAGIYDTWCSWRSRWRNERFRKEHGSL